MERTIMKTSSTTFGPLAALCIILTTFITPTSAATPQRDTNALLAFKANADNSDRLLANNWTGDPCLNLWNGVTCDKQSSVITLNLYNMSLTGRISPNVANLSSLVTLDLSYNALTGSIPPELGQLQNLTTLRLSSNGLTGPIPATLANLRSIESLWLNNNQLNGSITKDLGSPHLFILNLGANDLSGPIPAFANMPSIIDIILAKNRFTGPIPPALGNLSSLQSLFFSLNRLNGPIPPSLGRLSELRNLDFSGNSLTGNIPAELAKPPKLFNIFASDNHLSGSIPPQLSNAPSLETLDLSRNNFTGPIPPELGNMVNLIELSLSQNKLTGPVPPQLGNMTALNHLQLRDNNLTGSIPPELGKISKLSILDLAINNLTGSIPPQLQDLSNLALLYLQTNNLIGPIPPQLDPFVADLSNNFMNGTVPLQLANASVVLNCLGLGRNKYYEPGQRDSQVCANFYPSLNCSCPKPAVVGTNGSCYCVYPLQYQINFQCSDPWTLGNFTLNLADLIRQLADVASVEVAQVAPVSFLLSKVPCSVLFTFNVLPLMGTVMANSTSSIANLLKAKTLAVQVPFFDPGYVYISGQELTQPPNTTAPSQGPTSTQPRPSGGLSPRNIIILVAAVAFFALAVAVAASFFLRRKKPVRTVIPGATVKSWRFTELSAASDGFSDNNILGRGGFGFVFKGELDGSLVAIKRLARGSGQGHEELAKEVETIGTIHHRNLVSLQGYCIEGDEYLLVYNFMANGSLNDWLFKKPEGEHLSWPCCVKIIKGTANALAYLHGQCKEKIIHRDIKPANILLDEDFEAHVADFGLARTTVDSATHVSTRVVGSLGYIAPEYAQTGQLTDKSDVYSFGIVLLVTICHRPALELSQDGMVALVNEVGKNSEKDRLLDLINPSFAGDFQEEEALRLINVAVLCIQSPWHLRPSMEEVKQMLNCTLEIPTEELNRAIVMLEQQFRLFKDNSSISIEGVSQHVISGSGEEACSCENKYAKFGGSQTADISFSLV